MEVKDGQISGNKFIPPVKQEGDSPASVNDIPVELLDFILSHLDESDMQSAASVSKLWNERTIQTANEQNKASVGNAIQLIISKINMEASPEVVENLQAMINKNPISESRNLIDLKTNIHEIKIAIAKELAKLSPEQLKQLQSELAKETMPQLFANIVDLAKLFLRMGILEKTKLGGQKISLEALSQNIEAREQVERIAKELIKHGEFKEALKIAENLPGDAKSLVLFDLSRTLALKGKSEQSEKMIEESCSTFSSYIDDQLLKEDINSDEPLAFREVSYRLKELVWGLYEMGRIDNAIELADKTPAKMIKINILDDVLIGLLQQRDIDNALKLPDMYPFLNGLDAFKMIRYYCEVQGHSDKADIINEMFDKFIDKKIEEIKSESEDFQVKQFRAMQSFLKTLPYKDWFKNLEKVDKALDKII